MKAFLSKNKGLHRWLLADGVVLLLFFALRGNRALMNALVFRVTLPFEQLLGRLCAHVPFSVAGLFYILLVLDTLVCLVLAVRYCIRSGRKGYAVYRSVLFFVDFALSVYAAFCLLWGANYCVDDFCDRSGIAPEPVAVEDLARVTEYFAGQLTAYADAVPRDESGVFCADRAEIIAAAPAVYTGLYEEFPFLAAQDLTPKPFFLSKIMSYMDFTGFYFPFTGEANLNADFPPVLLPATALHEMTHQRGYSSEQQCNFVAILAALRADSDIYRYSGAMLGYIHLGNALYRADRDRWLEVYQSLSDAVIADFACNNAYWAQFEGPTAEVTQKLNDSMIRSYGDPLGTQSYGAVVDLLVKYYK